MPRVVDHQQRRDELVHAAWRLIVDDGLPGVTIRRLAERSGWSSGAVRHYLPTREAIIEAAAERVGAVIEQRVRAVPVDSDPVMALTGVLEAVLPTDEAMREASRVWLAFVGQAASDRRLAGAQGIVYRDLHALLVELLDWAQAQGRELPGGSEAVAVQLQGLVDGLTVHVLLGQVNVEDAKRAVADAVARSVG